MSSIAEPRDTPRDTPTQRDDEVARLRVPPHSVEAEQSVLGGLRELHADDDALAAAAATVFEALYASPAPSTGTGA